MCPLRIAIVSLLLLVSGPHLAEARNHPLTRAEPIARMVLQEANNEPFDGMVAVAGVAFDRISDPRWPNNAHDVVYQPYQFSGMSLRLGAYTVEQISTARFAVSLARLGSRPCGTSVFWYHTLQVYPVWAKQVVERCRVGNHIFYGDE